MQNRKPSAGHAAKGSAKAPGRQAEQQQQMQQSHDEDIDPSSSSESEFSHQGPGLAAEDPQRSGQQQRH